MGAPSRARGLEVVVCDPRTCTGHGHQLQPVGGGGLLDRRTLLLGGVGVGAAVWLWHGLGEWATTNATRTKATPARTPAKRPTTRSATATPTDPPVPPVTPAALLASRRLQLVPRAERDLRAGIVDPRLLALLARLLDSHTLGVSIFKTGHTKYVKGTRHVSQHYGGHACDIWAVDGRPITCRNSAAYRLVAALTELHGHDRPTEVGSPWPDFDPLTGWFSDAGHQDHLHLGVDR